MFHILLNMLLWPARKDQIGHGVLITGLEIKMREFSPNANFITANFVTAVFFKTFQIYLANAIIFFYILLLRSLSILYVFG